MFNPMENPDFAARMTRVQKAIHLEEPDRVPFVPTLGNICSNAYGVPLQDAMMDQRKIIPALDQMLEDLRPDYMYMLDLFPKEGMDILQPININYPGKTPEFGPNFTYQVVDHEFMEDDEY